jgi:hypothetical protein
VTVSGRGSFPLLLMLLLLWSMLNHQCTMVCMRRACAPCAMPMESFPMMLDGVPARCTVGRDREAPSDTWRYKNKYKITLTRLFGNYLYAVPRLRGFCLLRSIIYKNDVSETRYKIRDRSAPPPGTEL